MKGTYQARVSGHDEALGAYAGLYGPLERKLFAAWNAGKALASLKSGFISKHEIPARMFNSLRVSVRGKVKAAVAARELHAESLGKRIAKAGKVIEELEEAGEWQKLHHKRRRLQTLRDRLAGLKRDIGVGRVSMAFGSRKLWRAQYSLKANGCGSREEWLREWREARSGEFFVLGSRDESAGCQLCVATVSEDGSISLRLRMPDQLAGEHGKYVEFSGIRFGYGYEHVVAALDANREGGPGQALSYRFKRDRKGWRVFVTTEISGAEVVTDRRRGAIGVDVNEDHLAVTEVDSCGNWVRSFRVRLVTYGKSNKQAEALVGDAVAQVVEHGRVVGKPVVIEKLDFRGKKASLEGESARRARMLSSFGYGRIQAYFMSRGYRMGVEVVRVNPAFSSVAGRFKFAELYGLNGHQAAAMVLARRLLNFSERVPRCRGCPGGGGVRVVLCPPERKSQRHVWTSWGLMLRRLRLAHAALRRRGAAFGSLRPGELLCPLLGCGGGFVSASGLSGSRSAHPGGIPGRESSCTVGTAAPF